MATVLEQYRGKQAQLQMQVEADSLPPDSLPIMMEINYRISVFETLQTFCKTAPNSLEVTVLSYHYQLVNAYVEMLIAERKFGSKTDEEGMKRRETASAGFHAVVASNRKNFSNFKPAAPNQYKESICKFINTILASWIQYRNSYIEI